MGIEDWTPEEEDQVLSEIGEISRANAVYATTATQQESDTIAEILLAAPNVDPGLALAISDAHQLGMFPTIEDAQNFANEVVEYSMQQELDAVEAEPDRGWFRNIVDYSYGQLKGLSRAGLAGLQTLEQLGTSLYARGEQAFAKQVMSEPSYLLYKQQRADAGIVEPTVQNYDIKTLLATTDLGAYIASRGQGGEGFFVSGPAREIQERAAVAYRGGVTYPDGEVRGYTPGRGLGFLAGQPGSTAYNRLSGAIDATWALAAPTGVTKLAQGVKVGSRIFDEADVARGYYRSRAGLTNLVTPHIENDRVSGWLSGATGQWLTQRVVGTNDISAARKLLPNADLDTWYKLTEAKTTDAARMFLEENLGTTVMDIRNLSTSRFSDIKTQMLGNPVARRLGIERMAASRAESGKLWIGGANDLEKTATIRNLEDYLVAMKIEPAIRNSAINKMTKALLEDPGDMRNAILEAENIFVEAYAKKGLPEELLKEIFTKHRDELVGTHEFNVLDGTDGAAELYDLSNRLIRGIGEDGARTGVRGRQQRAVGFLDSEGRRYSIDLPEPDRVYRAFSSFNWMFSRAGISQRTGRMITNPKLPEKFLDEYGRARMPIAVLDFLHNKIWKRSVLVQGSYGVRIAGSGLLRQSFTHGLRSGIMHPYELITTAMFRQGFGRYKGTVMGEPWSAAEYLKFNEDMGQFVRDVSPRLLGEIQNKGKLELLSFRSGNWAPQARESALYKQGVMDNIHLLSQDRLARELIRSDFSVEEIIAKAKNGDKFIVDALRNLQSRLTNTLDMADGTRGTPEFFTSGGRVVDETVRFYLNDYWVKRIQRFVKSDPRLRDIVLNGDESGRFIDADGAERIAFQSVDGKLPAQMFGTYSDDLKKIVDEMIEADPDAFPPLVKARIEPALVETAEMSQAERNLLRHATRFVDNLFAELLSRPDAYLNRSVVWRKNYWSAIDDLLPQLDEAQAGRLIENLNEAYTYELRLKAGFLRGARADKDGKFRVEMYKRAMDDATRQKRLAAVEKQIAQKQAKPSEKWIINYVGGAERWRRIKNLANGTTPPTGSRTLDEINMLAHGYAADQVKKTLYDISGASNIEHVLRIVSPFIGAWREGVVKGAKFIATNPEATKRFSVSYQALGDYDPDGDGRGFIYTHPQTGQQVFSYPSNGVTGTLLAGFFGAATGFAFGPLGALAGGVLGTARGLQAGQQAEQFEEMGVDIEATVPVSSLNMELHASPGVGGIVQIPLNYILNRNVIPYSDDFARALVPFGAPGNVAIPASYRRIASAILNEPNAGTELASLRLEAAAALIATNKYDRNDAASNEKLWKDSESLAQQMLLYRGLGHFIGPGRPRSELRVPTRFEGKVTLEDVEYVINNGSIQTRMLSQIYNEMYRQNPETAAIEFVAAFGDNTYGYLVGLTKANISGLESSQEFYDWTIRNKDVVEALPTLYPYFVGNITNQYDNFVYRRQRELGERGLWESPELRIEAAEAVLGNRLYRTLVQAAGPDPSDEQLAMLRDYKIELEEKYPGYRRQTFEVGALEAKIDRLVESANMPVLETNSAAEAVRMYGTAREEILRVANQRRESEGRLPATQNVLSGKGNADLRAFLRLYGETLALYNPDFERVWSDVLFYEVDLEDS